MSQGWIKLHRKIQSNPLWTSEAFTRGQAWVDLILLANHEDGYFFVRDHRVNVKRGQVGWSQKRLGKRWQWSRTKVRSFLDHLEKEQQIKQHKSKSYTVITLINYDDYQQIDQEKTSEKHQKNNSSTSEKHQKNTNKNDKNVKNDKKNIPTLRQVKDYFKENGYDHKVAEKAYNIYSASLEDHPQRKYWRDSRGNMIKNWKLKMQSVWFTEENKIQKDESLYDTNKLRGITG